MGWCVRVHPSAHHASPGGPGGEALALDQRAARHERASASGAPGPMARGVLRRTGLPFRRKEPGAREGAALV